MDERPQQDFLVLADEESHEVGRDVLLQLEVSVVGELTREVVGDPLEVYRS